MTPTATESQHMFLADIRIGNRKRPADPRKVQELADSLFELGVMLNPITVDDQGELIAGYHRYEAARKLGWKKAPVHRVKLDKLKTELAQLDENLIRNELDTWVRDKWILRREELMEKLGKKARSGENQHGDKKRTIADSAAEIGMSSRSYQESLQRANALPDELEPAIYEAGIQDSPTQLLELARLPEEERLPALEKVIAGEAKSIKDVAESKKAHVANNTGNIEWYTPPKYLAAVRDVLGHIDTDPASCELANQHVQAATYYTAEQNGLEQPWAGNVYMNPPYAAELIPKFSAAFLAKWKAGEFGQGIVLVNNATETEWFQSLLNQANAVCFPDARIKFLDETGAPKNRPLQGQAFFYFGGQADQFALRFREFGPVLSLLLPARDAEPVRGSHPLEEHLPPYDEQQAALVLMEEPAHA